MTAILERKLQRFNVNIWRTLSAAGTFDVNMYVPFIPTELKVKQVGMASAALITGLYSVSCDALVGVSSSSLALVQDDTTVYPGITFTLSSPVGGTYTIRIIDQATGLVTTALNGVTIGINLEFRR